MNRGAVMFFPFVPLILARFLCNGRHILMYYILHPMKPRITTRLCSFRHGVFLMSFSSLFWLYITKLFCFWRAIFQSHLWNLQAERLTFKTLSFPLRFHLTLLKVEVGIYHYFYIFVDYMINWKKLTVG